MPITNITTFGCRLNSFESEIIKQYAKEYGLEDFYFINTCAVTAESERQARQKIRRIKKLHPQTKIVVTGCMAQIFPRKLEELPEVDFIIGNAEKLQSSTYEALKLGTLPRILVSDPNKTGQIDPSIVTKFDGKVRAFVQIQNGCSNNCAYCIITKARGKSRSVSVQGVVDQVKALASNYPEIMLTGVNIAEYGTDISYGINLSMLIKRIFNLVPEMQFLGLSSISPYGVSDDLINLITTNTKILPHIHLSVQSGDDEILRAMKREPYCRADVINLVSKLKQARPEIIIGADIITGFPGETQEQFENTLTLIDEAQIDLLHAFPFSKRLGTEAYYMPCQIEHKIAKERLHILKDAVQRRFTRLLDSMIGTEVTFIPENKQEGKTINYIPVFFNEDLIAGQVYKKRAIHHYDNHLVLE